MKIKPSLFIIVLLATSCLQNKQEKTNLPFIDVTKDYPEKEIILTDVANLTYLYLDSDNDDYIFSGGISDITKNTIVVHDYISGSIMFFSKDGTPKSRLNRKGEGPEEYSRVGRIFYDEELDDVFVYTHLTGIIQVYSSKGEYKRKINIPEKIIINGLIPFDNESFLLFDANMYLKKTIGEEDLPSEFIDTTFVRISKIDGKILDYVELTNNRIVLKDNIQGRAIHGHTSRMIKHKEGVLLCNPETDTVFLYHKDKSLIPVICKHPLLNSLDPMVYLNNCLDVNDYQFMEVFTTRWEEGAFPFPAKYYIRDKKTGEIFIQKIILPDYKGKEFIFSVQTLGDNENGYCFELELIELKQAYNENKLSGKLKELVATLDENEDNNVFMLVNFK